MAEIPDESKDSVVDSPPATVSMEAITQQLLSGQSKCTSATLEEFNEAEHVASDGGNSMMLICKFCNCKVMRSGKGSLVKREMSLPVMTEKYKIGSKPTVETCTEHWLVTDMFDFENVGFSKNVDDIKYLICADCERGPVGWHIVTETDKFYISCTRVKYGQS